MVGINEGEELWILVGEKLRLEISSIFFSDFLEGSGSEFIWSRVGGMMSLILGISENYILGG